MKVAAVFITIHQFVYHFLSFIAGQFNGKRITVPRVPLGAVRYAMQRRGNDNSINYSTQGECNATARYIIIWGFQHGNHFLGISKQSYLFIDSRIGKFLQCFVHKSFILIFGGLKNVVANFF